MTNESRRIQFQEAFSEALAEEEVAALESPTPASVEPGVQNGPELEQPAVETEEETSLFAGLDSEEADGEQPPGDSHEVTVRGETFAVSLQELKDGYQRQADYTRSKQELAEMESKHGKAITLWEALESDYAGTVQKLLSRTGMKGSVAPQAQGVDLDALVEAKLQEKLASDPRLQQFEQEAAIRQIEHIFDGIEQDFQIQLTDEDKQIVLEKSQEMQTTDLRYVVYNLLQLRQQREAQQKNLELVSTVAGRRSGDVEDFTPQVEYYSTVADAWQAALAEEGNLS
jgi:hypothetical protein